MNSSPVIRFGGWSLIAGAILFVAVFTYLAAAFDYPNVLDGSAGEVLPRLQEGGSTLRGVWAFYSLLPLLWIPAGVGAYLALKDDPPGIMLIGLPLAFISALVMMLGLMRWPSIHWHLARGYGESGPEAQDVLAAVFAGVNTYMGNYIGEFLGEVSIAVFFLVSALTMRRAARFPRWMGPLGMAAASLLLVGALRNAIPSTQVVAEVNNLLLPLWMIVFGWGLIKFGPRPQ